MSICSLVLKLSMYATYGTMYATYGTYFYETILLSMLLWVVDVYHICLSYVLFMGYICCHEICALHFKIIILCTHWGGAKENRNIYCIMLSWITLLNVFILCMVLDVWLSSTNKKGEIESASCPYIKFWCWWQYTCRGLTMFVKWISGFSPWMTKVCGPWTYGVDFTQWTTIKKLYIYLFLSIGSLAIKRGVVGVVKDLLMSLIPSF